MLFGSYDFLLIFLPATLLAFHAARRLAAQFAPAVLLAASLVFYGYWNVSFLAMLAVLIVANYTATYGVAGRHGGFWLIASITWNLGILFYFKYRNFFLENLSGVGGWAFQPEQLIIPLAISFYTFQHIALLIDVRRGGDRPRSLQEFALFIAFFPQLIAGPVVLFREVAADLRRIADRPGLARMAGAGLVVFVFGLFKKVAFADNIGLVADQAFALPDPTMLEAWYGALAFTVQIYFDFSGYADMAVGLGLMFGIRLPVNFKLPYRARNIHDFWERWHITLTRFFTFNLYQPVNMSATRALMRRRASKLSILVLAVSVPVVMTFLLSGLWHGAGWNFIAWGGVHGVALVVFYFWRTYKFPQLPYGLGWLLTMLVQIFSLVLFRATSLGHGMDMLGAMVSPGALVLPGWLRDLAAGLGLQTATMTLFPSLNQAGLDALWLAALIVLAIGLPNPAQTWRRLKPDWRTAAATATMAVVIAAIGFDQPRAFIYFQF